MAEQDVTGRLALLAMVGDLLVGIEASLVFQIRRGAETSVRRIEQNLYAVDLEDETIPGWDLGDLFQVGTCVDSWVIVEANLSRKIRRFGLRMGRCIAVRPLPPCSALPAALFSTRLGALAAGFATVSLVEVTTAPSGVVVDVHRLLTTGEIDAGSRVLTKREARDVAT